MTVTTPIARRTRSAIHDAVASSGQQLQIDTKPKRLVFSATTPTTTGRTLSNFDPTLSASKRSLRLLFGAKQPEETGECPVCGQIYGLSHLNAHVNRCLEDVLASPPPPSSPATTTTTTTETVASPDTARYVPPKLSKCAYGVMKDKQLRALLEVSNGE